MKKNYIAVLSALTLATSVITVPMHKILAASQTAISRSQIEQRATSIMDLTWTYSSSKNSVINSQYSSIVTLPSQFQGITSAQFTGIPYDWGGIDGVDTYSYNAPWTTFLDAVNNGAFAGNVNSDGGIGYVPGTAGMDCSGFVQAAFNIKDYKQSTTTLLNNYFTQIDINSLQHMDILDKPGDHVAIFDKWGTLNGISGAFTYEATPDQTYGGIQGTKRYFISMNTINQGYIPARYKYIVDDSTSQVSSGAGTNTQTTSSNTSTSSTTTSSTNNTSTTAQTSTSTINNTSPTTSAPLFKIGGYAQVANVLSYANLRSNAGTSYAILATIPKGTVLNITNYSNGWYQVNYNGQTGWISGTLLGSVPAGQYVTVNSVSMLNIRLNPSTTAQIVGTLSKGQIALKLDQTPYGSWYKISINGVQGWSSSIYLTYIQ